MEVIASKKVKIRKERKCWTCAKNMVVGSIMNRVVSKDGEIMVAYFCGCCQAFINKMDDYFQDGLSFGEFSGEEEYERFKKEYDESKTI